MMEGSWGGARAGAGRPRKAVRRASRVMRVPEGVAPQVVHLIAKGGLKIPLYSSPVQAGFPSPAEDYVEDGIDLNEFLIRHPAATFMVRAKGDSMTGAGIHSGDLLIVDRSIEPATGCIVVAAVAGEFTVKRFSRRGEEIALLPENPAFEPITFAEGEELQIFGVVTAIIRSL